MCNQLTLDIMELCLFDQSYECVFFHFVSCRILFCILFPLSWSTIFSFVVFLFVYAIYIFLFFNNAFLHVA